MEKRGLSQLGAEAEDDAWVKANTSNMSTSRPQTRGLATSTMTSFETNSHIASISSSPDRKFIAVAGRDYLRTFRITETKEFEKHRNFETRRSR